MKKKAKIVRISHKLLIVLFFIAILSPLVIKRDKNDVYVPQVEVKGYHKVDLGKDNEYVLSGISINKESSEVFKYPVKGGIVPHHLLASSLIADFLKQIASQDIQKIVLIGPNHFEKGESIFLTSEFAWETEFGAVYPDIETINYLTNDYGVGIDENVLQNEHAIYGIVPFIKYYLPNAKVTPIIISTRASRDDIQKLSEDLSSVIDEGTLVLVSVDFSHYLNLDQASQNDEKTMEMVKNFDVTSVSKLGNDYVDSANSVILLLSLMEKMNAKKIKVINHTNSAVILEDDLINETTSYFTIYFY